TMTRRSWRTWRRRRIRSRAKRRLRSPARLAPATTNHSADDADVDAAAGAPVRTEAKVRRKIVKAGRKNVKARRKCVKAGRKSVKRIRPTVMPSAANPEVTASLLGANVRNGS